MPTEPPHDPTPPPTEPVRPDDPHPGPAGPVIHDHDAASDPELQQASPALRRRLAVAVGIILVALVASALVLFPHDYVAPAPDDSLARTENVSATVTRVDLEPCGDNRCLSVAVRLDDGPDAGTTVELPDMGLGTATQRLGLGDEIVVSRVTIVESGQTVYNFADHQRSRTLWILAIGFGVLVVVIARWRGAAALVGLGLTWIVFVGFLVPAILSGANPVAASLTAAGLVAVIVLYLAHGVSARTTIALLGTLGALVLTGLLSVVFVALTRLTGLASEELGFIVAQGATVDARGLLLAGIILGTLGVLTDITVTQVAVVWEVHAADPGQSRRALYAAGMRTGRDHIASTVDTLVLAYAGASIPLLVLFILGGQQFGDTATSEVVAAEIVRTLLGSIGLVASVPFTTALAAFVVTSSAAQRRTVDAPSSTLPHPEHPSAPSLIPDDVATGPRGDD